MAGDNIISVSGLTKFYKGMDDPAVNIEELTIEEGEIFGLLGPNGAGKTSTLSILSGLLQPSEGRVSIAGFDLIRDLRAIKHIIGVVTQDIALYPTLSARENLLFFGSMYGIKGNVLKNNINRYLDQFGLGKSADRKLETFSGGMKRRVNIIAAIMHQPKILFLDEPTVGIDVQSRNLIMEHLKEFNKNGMTILYTSHHMEEAQNFCTQVAIIDQGKIIAKGKPAALISSHPEYRNLEGMFLHLTGKAMRD
jgi:ABC-2 type transport system ATP-binding protein